MSRIINNGIFLAAIFALISGCATSSYGPLRDVITLKDREGRPVAGATVLPVQEVFASFENYYSKAERKRRTSDIDGRVWINLAEQYSESKGEYRFWVSKEGYREAVINIPKEDFHGILSVDLVPPKKAPNQPTETTRGK